MNRRALLLSGGWSRDKDYPRYRNNIAAFYRLLLGMYGFQPEEIRVCMSAGGAHPLAEGGRLVQVQPARRATVIDALRWLAELREGDLAFLLVTDHGEKEGITLWGKSQFLTPADIAGTLGSSAAIKVFVLGQCFAARFAQLSLPRAVFCCACGPDESAYPTPAPRGVEPDYSEFLYQLAGALGGVYPDGEPLDHLVDDPPPPDRITLAQAFRYARDHDHWVTGTRAACELPRLIDPDGIADSLSLGRTEQVAAGDAR